MGIPQGRIRSRMVEFPIRAEKFTWCMSKYGQARIGLCGVSMRKSLNCLLGDHSSYGNAKDFMKIYHDGAKPSRGPISSSTNQGILIGCFIKPDWSHPPRKARKKVAQIDLREQEQ